MKGLTRSSPVYKQKQSKTVLNKYVGGFDVREQQGLDGFTQGSAIMDYLLSFFLARSDSLKIECLEGFVFTSQDVIDGLEACELL